MKCPYCNEEMKEGYLFGSKDGALSFAKETPAVFSNAKKADGYIKIADFEVGHRTRIKAFVCENCKKIIADY